MSKYRTIAAGLIASALLAVGCSVAVSPGTPATPTTILVSATGRSIPAGQQLLAFLIEPLAGRRVTISVQASTDAADPEIEVIRGNVTVEERDDVTLGDVIDTANDERPGQEIGRFTPEFTGEYTIFVRDDNDIPSATFSVTVTQN